MTESQGGGRTVGAREGLGAGIIAIGVLQAFLPTVIDKLPSVANGGDPAFILNGMSVIFGVVVIVAGIMTWVVKD